MKDWLKRLREMKAAPWIGLLCACICACLLLPSGGGAGGAMTQEEQRVSATLSRIAGAGETRVSIFYAAKGDWSSAGNAPSGAVIVSAGAWDVRVQLALCRAAQALLGLPDGAIAIFPMEEAGQ